MTEAEDLSRIRHALCIALGRPPPHLPRGPGSLPEGGSMIRTTAGATAVSTPTTRGYTSGTGMRIGAGRDHKGGYCWTIHYKSYLLMSGHPASFPTLDEAWGAAQANLRVLITEFYKGLDT